MVGCTEGSDCTVGFVQNLRRWHLCGPYRAGPYGTGRQYTRIQHTYGFQDFQPTPRPAWLWPFRFGQMYTAPTQPEKRLSTGGIHRCRPPCSHTSLTCTLASHPVPLPVLETLCAPCPPQPAAAPAPPPHTLLLLLLLSVSLTHSPLIHIAHSPPRCAPCPPLPAAAAAAGPRNTHLSLTSLACALSTSASCCPSAAARAACSSAAPAAAAALRRASSAAASAAARAALCASRALCGKAG